jgi:hypothetical protein
MKKKRFIIILANILGISLTREPIKVFIADFNLIPDKQFASMSGIRLF